ncbi:MAG TPA: hypothetical protein VLT33_06865 [Labilithrix sp.]|nr:hypothetical protein [Labilithrix sp.]
MTTTTTILSLTLGAFLAACAAETTGGDGDGTSTPPAATSATDPAPAPGNAPEYAVSCQGQITKKAFSFELTPRCAGGAPGSKCGDPCAAQDIAISYVPPATRCGSVERFVWDGTACKKYLTNDGGEMHCKGADCERMFTSEALCKAAYETCTPK